MISWIKNWLERRRHDAICEEYRNLAAGIGDALSMMGMGDPYTQVRGKMYSVRDPQLYHILNEVEEKYAELGYRIIPLERWVNYGGWGVSIDDVWQVKREEGERPQYTILEPREEIPAPSPLVDLVLKTGKPHVAEVDAEGNTTIRMVDDGRPEGCREESH